MDDRGPRSVVRRSTLIAGLAGMAVALLARRGVVAGCSGSAYCPDAAVSRADMAVFLVGAFGLH